MMMVPTNKKLAEKAKKSDAVPDGEYQQLIKRWKALNYNRTLMVGVGALMGAVATYMSS